MKVGFFLGIILILITGVLFGEDGFKYDAKSKRDPFVPLVSEEGAYVSDAYGIKDINDIRLEGIVWDKRKGSAAIINGEIVREGDEIGSVKLIKIERECVVFDIDGEEVKIDLMED